MNVEQSQRLQACVQEIAEILYQNTPAEELTTLEGIEQAVRGHLLKEIGPQLGFFLSKRAPARRKVNPEHSKAVSETCDSGPNNFSA